MLVHFVTRLFPQNDPLFNETTLNPSPVGSFPKTNPPANQVCKRYKYLEIRLIHKKSSQKSVGSFRRNTCLRSFPPDPSSTNPAGCRDCRARYLPVRRSLPTGEGGSFRYRAAPFIKLLPPPQVLRSVCCRCASIHTSRADYTHPTAPRPVKLSIYDSVEKQRVARSLPRLKE